MHHDPEASALPDIGFDDFLRIDIRVGQVIAADDLIGRQITGVVSFPLRQIGKFMSEVPAPGVPDAHDNVILLSPEKDVPPAAECFR